MTHLCLTSVKPHLLRKIKMTSKLNPNPKPSPKVTLFRIIKEWLRNHPKVLKMNKSKEWKALLLNPKNKNKLNLKLKKTNLKKKNLKVQKDHQDQDPQNKMLWKPNKPKVKNQRLNMMIKHLRSLKRALNKSWLVPKMKNMSWRIKRINLCQKLALQKEEFKSKIKK